MRWGALRREEAASPSLGVVELFRQRLALDQLQDDRRLAVGFVEAVDRGDIGVVQRREQLRLALESRDAIRVGHESVGEDLDRDVATELGVARAIDLAHPAGAEWRDDFIRPEARTVSKQHGVRAGPRIIPTRPIRRSDHATTRPRDPPTYATYATYADLYNARMARYTLVYGVRLIPEGTLKGVEEATLKLADGSSAGLTLHTFDGTIPQLRRSLDRSLDAFFDLLPGAADEDIETFGD